MFNASAVDKGFDKLFATNRIDRQSVDLNFECSLDDYVSQYYSRAKVLTIQGVKIYFSYATPIACSLPGELTTVTAETFSPTTAKHKARIPHRHDSRVGRDTFRTILAADIIEAADRVKQSRGSW